MNAPTIARILGVLFLLAGIAAFVPWLSPAYPAFAPDAPVITLDLWYRFVATLFPVNVVHTGLHIFFGLWGLLAALRFGSAVFYCRTVALAYLILAILGALPVFAFQTLFGIAPIYGWDVGLHFVIAFFAAYGGFGRAATPPEEAAAG